MKKLLFLIVLLIPSICFSATAKWEASEGADGYYLYFISNGIEKHVTLGNVTEYPLELAPGEYQIFVSAFNVAGESGRSNMVNYVVSGYVPVPSDPPETMSEKPETPSGLSLIGDGFVMIWRGLKGLI